MLNSFHNFKKRGKKQPTTAPSQRSIADDHQVVALNTKQRQGTVIQVNSGPYSSYLRLLAQERGACKTENNIPH